MGGKSTKIVYETVDKTDPKAREQGRQAAIEENARLVRQMEERLKQQQNQGMAAALAQVRQENERDVQRSAENKRRAAELEAKRIRDEQFRQEQLTVLKMKESLLHYEFGKKITMTTFQSEGLEVGDMERVRIALFGPTGSGKTSFIGTLERSLLGEDKQTAFEQGAGAEGTVVLEEYLSALKFNLVDTRGFWNIDDSTADECLNIMTGRINVGTEIQRDYDIEEPRQTQVSKLACARFGDRVHAVIFVVQAHDTRLTDQTYLTRMKKIRDHFRHEGYSTVTVITCEDKLKSSEDRQLAFREASAATGSPEDRTYFITNYTYEHNTFSLATEKAALNIIDHALLSAGRFVKIQKLREKNHGTGLGGFSGGEAARGGGEAVQHFLSRLQTENDWETHRVARVLKVLADHQICTVAALKACWEEIKGDLQLSVGMRGMIGNALK